MVAFESYLLSISALDGTVDCLNFLLCSDEILHSHLVSVQWGLSESFLGGVLLPLVSLLPCLVIVYRHTMRGSLQAAIEMVHLWSLDLLLLAMPLWCIRMTRLLDCDSLLEVGILTVSLVAVQWNYAGDGKKSERERRYRQRPNKYARSFHYSPLLSCGSCPSSSEVDGGFRSVTSISCLSRHCVAVGCPVAQISCHAGSPEELAHWYVLECD